ncbi:efflux RND transporter permease subunit, partial [uncultured Thiodictyon sp.]|uniref:efflux RND transporter permease subunit n=1 Tax=uncultured Thiodictyon sp. TaxID=1846217 RepID=UPI0025EB9A49
MKRGLITVFARHKLLANVLTVLVFGLGTVALSRMNIQFFPSFALDIIAVQVVWSGASAEDVENGIVIPFEERLKTVDGLKRMTSTSSQGIASVSLELNEGTDALLALDQVRQRVDEFRNLPKDAETPQVSRISRYESVARVLVSGPSLHDVRPWVRQFERELLARGIDRVDIAGLPQERIAIEVPGRTLETLGLSLDGIGQQVGRLAQDLPSGVAGEADGARELRGLEQRRDPVAFENLSIVSDERGLVRLGDVATIVRESRPAALTMTEVETGTARSHGAVTVEMLIQRAETGHSLRAARVFEQWLADTRPTLPPSIQLTVFDQAWQLIRDRIDLLVSNGLQGFVLVLVLLYIFLPGRVALWVAMGIPTAYLLALALLWAFGGTINMMSLFALLLTLGVIDDDAIVIGEYAESRFRMGMAPAEAAIAGAKRMFWPVVGSALTTVAAFLPLMLVGGIMGNILWDIPFVAIMVLMASLMEVFLIMPAHLRSAFSHQVRQVTPRWRQRVDAGFDRFRDRWYRPAVVASLRWRAVTVSAVAVLMLLSVGLLAGGRIAFVFFPTPEAQIVFANATFVAGTPRAQTAAFLDELQEGLGAAERDLGGGLVEAAVARLGSTVAVNVGAAASGDQLASVLVQLVPSENRSVRNEAFLAKWRERVRLPAGIESLVISSRRSGPPGRDLTVRLTGDDAHRLKSAALDLAQGLE